MPIETKALTEYALAIYFGDRFHAWVDRMFDANEDEFHNHSACTERPERAKRWKSEVGARRNAARYERHNPGSRVEIVSDPN